MSLEDDGGDDVLTIIRNAAASEGVSVDASHAVGVGGDDPRGEDDHPDLLGSALPADDDALGRAMKEASVGGVDDTANDHGKVGVGEGGVEATAAEVAKAEEGAPAADGNNAAAAPPVAPPTKNKAEKGSPTKETPEKRPKVQTGGEQPRSPGGNRRNRGAAKRKAWSLAFKKEMCRKFRDGGYKTQRTFLLEINQGRAEDDKIVASNFQKWWTEVKSGKIVLEELSTDTDDRLKRRRIGRFDTVEKRLAEYVKLCESGLGDGTDGLTMSNLKQKAKEYAKELGDTQFKASGTWLYKFRQRNGIQKFLLQSIEEQMEAEERNEEQKEPEVTASEVREALSTLSAFAAQEKDGEMALDIARLHQRLLLHERDIAKRENENKGNGEDDVGSGRGVKRKMKGESGFDR